MQKPDKNFKLAFVSTMKHGDLLKAMKDRGWNQSQAANFFGISVQRFGDFINMKNLPHKVSQKLEVKFVEFTGKMYEDLFPEELRESELMKQARTGVSYADIPMPLLLNGFIPNQLNTSPEEVFDRIELREIFDEQLSNLDDQRKKVIIDRFFKDLTLDEIAQDMGFTRQRIHQLEQSALNKLRLPLNSKRIRQFLSKDHKLHQSG